MWLDESEVFFDESTTVLFVLWVESCSLADLLNEDDPFDLALGIDEAFVDLEEVDEEWLSDAVWFYSVVILAFIVVKFVGIYSPS